MTSGIYKIENKINGKIYIGCSKDIERRFKQHKLKTKKTTSIIKKAINKHGVDNFTFKILLQCPNICFDYWEKKYISDYNSMVPNGYNLTGGGEYQKIISEETRNRLINSHIGQIAWNKGISLSDEHKKKLCKPKTRTTKLTDYWNTLKGKSGYKKGKGFIEYTIKNLITGEIIIGTSFEICGYVKNAIGCKQKNNNSIPRTNKIKVLSKKKKVYND